MNDDQINRLIGAWEGIGKALEGLHDEVSRAGKRYWPEPGPKRDTIITSVVTEEDQRAERRRQEEKIPIEDWLKNFRDPDESDEPEGVVGDRSRQWFIDHPPEAPKETEVVDAGSEATIGDKKGRKGVKKAESKA